MRLKLLLLALALLAASATVLWSAPKPTTAIAVTDRVDIIDGRVDVNEDGFIDAVDDLDNVLLIDTGGVLDQVDILDGEVDVDEDHDTTSEFLSNVVLRLADGSTDQVDILVTGEVDVDEDGDIDAADDLDDVLLALAAGVADQVDIIGGGVDVDENGSIDAADDLDNVLLIDTGGVLNQVDILDGEVDVDEDGLIDTADDLDNVLLIDTGGVLDQVDILDGEVDVDESATITGEDILANVLLDLQATPPALVYDWVLPAQAEMGRSYTATLTVTNPANVHQQAEFALQLTGVSYLGDPVPSRALPVEATAVFQGADYDLTKGNTLYRSIPPKTSVTFTFGLTNKWQWIEPWDAWRILTIALGLIPKFGDYVIMYAVGSTALQAVDQLTFEYDTISSSSSAQVPVEVEVPESKKTLLAGSFVETGLASIATAIGSASGAAPFFIAEAIGILASEGLYALAADPPADYRYPAEVPDIEVPSACLSTQEEVDAAELAVSLLESHGGLGDAYNRLEAALTVGDGFWAEAHRASMLAFAQDAEVAAVALGTYLETIAPVQLPTEGELAAALAASPLPDVEVCILQAFGYERADIDEIEIALDGADAADLLSVPPPDWDQLQVSALQTVETAVGEVALCLSDTDLDGLDDCFEATLGTDPQNSSTDGDGCTDGQELGPDETLGGRRDPLNPWDFYDVAGLGGGPDGEVDLFLDILGVILHYSLDGSPPYDVQFDRGPTAGPNPWNMTAPDGSIDLFVDILGVIQQYGHHCT